MARRTRKERRILSTVLALGIILAVIGQAGLLYLALMGDDRTTRLLYVLQITGIGMIGLWKSLR